MTYFAKVIDGRVHEVIVADQAFIDSGAVGTPAQWIQTSKYYDANIIRKHPAVVGGHYDVAHDAFYDQQPHPGWVLNQSSFVWEAPVARPNDGKNYIWNETTTSWVEKKSLL